MNEIQIYLKTSGSIAELYKDFNLYVGSYQNVLLSVYVPTSLLYQNQQGTYVNAVKTGAITTAPNGTQVTTDGYGMDYVNTVTVDNVEYAVYGQKLPNTFVTYAGTQTVVVNVVAIDNTNPDSPVILQIVTSQTAPLVVQQSAYLGQEPAIPPEEVDVINGRLSTLEQSVDGLEENKLDKQTMSSGQYRAYVVTPDGNQGTIGIIDGSVSSAEQLANNIARYDSFGRLATSTPTENQHATNKQYVDAADENLSNEIETFKTNQTTINSSVSNTLQQLAADIVTSEQETGAFINGHNTLKDVMASVEVQSENLIPLPYDDLNGRVENGITYTINSDGSLTLNGTATGYSTFTFSYTKQFLLPGTYTFSCVNSTSEIRCIIRKNNSSWIDIIGTPQVANFEKNDVLNQVNIFVFQGAVCNNLTLYPKIQAGTVATPYTQYLPAGTSVNITACGKNLIPFPYYSGTSTGLGGVTVKINEDNSLTFNGTNSDNEARNFLLAYELTLPAGTYYVSCKGEDLSKVHLVTGGNNSGIQIKDGERAFTLTNRGQMGFCLLQVRPNAVIDNLTLYPQLEYSSSPSDYEKYQSQEYSSQVGKTVDVEQYDGITNIFVTTVGGAVSTQFLLSTKYELEDKVNLLVGTFANRPTTTQKYGLIYIATDQTGANRVTYLPPNTDGSTTGNWISFNS